MAILHQRPFRTFALAILLMAFPATFFGILQYLTPYQMDDLSYGRLWKASMTGNVPGPSAAVLLDFAGEHWANVNGRLGDKLLVLVLTWFPKWLTGFVMALSSFSIFLWGSKIAFGSISRKPVDSILLTGLFVIFLPWGSYMMLTNMALNYVWGAGIAVFVLYLFVRQPRINLSGILLYPGAFLLALIAAAWHEACGVPICIGMLALLIMKRRDNTALRVILFAGAVAGVLLIFSAPGFWVRYHGLVSHHRPEAYMLPAILKGLNIALVLPLLMVVLIFVARFRRAVSPQCRSAIVMGGVSVMVAIAIFLKSIYVMRVFWYVDIFAISVLGMVLGEIVGNRLYKSRVAAAWLMTGVILIHACVTLAWQVKITGEHDAIIDAYARSSDGVVYYDFSGRGFGPMLTLRRARIYSFTTDMRNYPPYITSFYREDGVPLSLVPTGLKDFDMRRFPRGRRVALIEGHFVMRGDTVFDRLDGYYPTYVTDRGEQMSIRTLVNPFQAADGTRLYYLEPEERHVGNARLVDIIP